MREIHCNKSLNEYRPLINELEELQVKGVVLTLDGERSNPLAIARSCILAEDCSYMRDYITRPDGSIERIDFNKVDISSIRRLVH